MAKKRRKKKFRFTNRQRFKTIVFVVLLTVCGFVLLLNNLGIITIDDILIKTGLKDKPARHADTEVHFVDVGQGDCTLVISDGKVMLIDSGDRDEKNRAVNYLKSQGITVINCVIVTHPHSDHIGEMTEILQQFKVGKFIMPKVKDEYVPTTSIYEDMLLELKSQGLKITKASDCNFELGNCSVELFTPEGDYENLNNYSTIVKITHGDNSFLITGDCEVTEEKDLLSQDFNMQAKVLKAGHHGSKTSSSSDFLNVVLPRYAVISCGEGNKYGHPHDETVTRLKKYANDIYITKDDGTVIFKSDGEGLTVETSKRRQNKLIGVK